MSTQNLSGNERTLWDAFFAKHDPQTVYHGKVISVVAFGAIVELARGVEGLIRTHNPQLYTVGEEVDVTIGAVKHDDMRMTVMIV